MVLGPHLLPSPLSSVNRLLFRGIQSYSYMEQRKVETDVDRMTGIELSSYVCLRSLDHTIHEL